MPDFAPSPMHGAAYAVAIEAVGGNSGVAGCNTPERYAEARGKLDALNVWAATQALDVRSAYRYGIDKVDGDLRARLEIFKNSIRVNDALATIPRPPL